MFEIIFCDRKIGAVDFLINNTWLHRENSVNKIFIWNLNFHTEIKFEIDGFWYSFEPFYSNLFNVYKNICSGEKRKELSMLSTPWKSVQILTDIPGFVEN